MTSGGVYNEINRLSDKINGLSAGTKILTTTNISTIFSLEQNNPSKILSVVLKNGTDFYILQYASSNIMYFDGPTQVQKDGLMYDKNYNRIYGTVYCNYYQ